MKVTPKHAILTVKKASKRDDGPYRVVMQNNLGKDDADVKAKVKGMRTTVLWNELFEFFRIENLKCKASRILILVTLKMKITKNSFLQIQKIH